MHYKYGEYSKSQIENIKSSIRKQIYFLLLIVDKKTKDDYPDVDVDEAYEGLLLKLGGLNHLLNEPKELVVVMSLLSAALLEYHNPEFRYQVYRKLVLEAGSEVLKIKEV